MLCETVSLTCLSHVVFVTATFCPRLDDVGQPCPLKRPGHSMQTTSRSMTLFFQLLGVTWQWVTHLCQVLFVQQGPRYRIFLFEVVKPHLFQIGEANSPRSGQSMVALFVISVQMRLLIGQSSSLVATELLSESHLPPPQTWLSLYAYSHKGEPGIMNHAALIDCTRPAPSEIGGASNDRKSTTGHRHMSMFDFHKFRHARNG